MPPDRPPRILRVITRLNVGGPARHAIYLTERFRTLGWASELAAGTPAPEESSMEADARIRGVEPLYLPELEREIRPLRDLIALWKVYRLLLRLRPDILHTHMAKAGMIGRTAALLYRRLHGRGAWAPRPLRVYHTFHGHVLRGYFSPVKETLFRRIEAVLARLTTRLITLSPALREELAALGVAPHERVSVVPLGIELEPFLAVPEVPLRPSPLHRELSLPGETPLVGIVGRLVPIKDHATFLEAMRLLLGEGGRASSAQFLIVGDGELRAETEARARALGLEGHCRFLGWRMDLPEVYASLDLVALTSRNEGTPLSLIEAMAAGRPTLATQVGGVIDVVTDRDRPASPPPPGDYRLEAAGAVAAAGDSRGLARAAARILNEPELARSLGRAGRVIAQRRYGVQRLVEDLRRIYLAGC